jgi:TldD protein
VRSPDPFLRLEPRELTRALECALAGGARFAEIFLEHRITRFLRREEGRLRGASASVDFGAGVRAVAGSGTGYAWTSSPDGESLRLAAEAAARIGTGREREPPRALAGAPPALSPLSPGQIPDLEWPIERRASYLASLDDAAHGGDPRVVEVIGSIAEDFRTIRVINTASVDSTDRQVLTSIRAAVFVRGPDGTLRGQYGGGGREEFASLAAGRLAPGAVAAEALRRALVGVEAVAAPTGEMPVVIGNGWGGVLLHEAIGHGFEADFVRRGTSIFAGKLGEQVSRHGVTVVDDPGVAGLRGSYRMDDEGTPAARTTLIEDGVLTGYLHDLISADALSARATGNGRRASFRNPPVPRQSNLFLEPGAGSPEEIISSVGRGIYAKGIGGGQVDIVNGRFVFEVTEGYLIEAGRITAPVRGANLIGSGAGVLNLIERIGSDFSFDPGTGTCGKDGQSQPVGVGQPTVLVSAMTIGGTKL